MVTMTARQARTRAVWQESTPVTAPRCSSNLGDFAANDRQIRAGAPEAAGLRSAYLYLSA